MGEGFRGFEEVLDEFAGEVEFEVGGGVEEGPPGAVVGEREFGVGWGPLVLGEQGLGVLPFGVLLGVVSQPEDEVPARSGVRMWTDVGVRCGLTGSLRCGFQRRGSLQSP